MAGRVNKWGGSDKRKTICKWESEAYSVNHIRWSLLWKYNSWKPLTIFTQSSILNVWLGSQYAFGSGVWDIKSKESKNENKNKTYNTFLVFKMQIHLLEHLNFVKNVPSLIQDLVHGEAKNCFWFCRFQ